MEKKFDSNVATQIPKTRMTHEPRLPWEVTQDDLDGSQFVDSGLQSASLGKAPFGIKPVALIVILIFIFVATLSAFLFMAQINKKAKAEIEIAEAEKALFISSLKATANEAKALKEKNAQLEKSMTVLDTQNKDFMAVIKNLSGNEEDKPAVKRNR
jgi:hypothetical protein